MPKEVAKKIQSLQCNFLWGGNENRRKKAWPKWDYICKSKREGGLGIKKLGDFNLALLCKWLWRFMGEKNSLWSKVIKSRFGDIVIDSEGIRTEFRGNGCGGWWRKVVSLVEGEKGRWFWGNLDRVLGSGRSEYFWTRKWAGNNSLKDRFPRLYQLSSNKKGVVSEIGEWREGEWHWEVMWRRNIFDRERAMIDEFHAFLQNFKLTEGTPDRWRWNVASDGVYSMSKAYKQINGNIDTGGTGNQRGSFIKLWKTMALQKAKVSPWRLLWNWLPTLKKIGNLFEMAAEEQRCRCCNLSAESARHLFITCPAIEALWRNIVGWVGASWAPPSSIEGHFLCFSGLLGGEDRRMILGGLWICVVWIVWKWRNSVVFEGKE